MIASVQPAIEQVDEKETPTWDVEIEEIIKEPEPEVEQVEGKFPTKELVEVDTIAQPEIVEVTLEDMTHTELKAIAKSGKIFKYYKMNKAQLMQAIGGINK
jgi:hypothetical protein